MTSVTIRIETGNAAFALDPAMEIARILRDLADQFTRDGSAYPPRDHNGNTVGTIEIE